MADNNISPEQAANTNTAGGGHFCAVCGVPAFLGYANDLKTRYCAEHMPGLSEAERETHRRAAAGLRQ
jgi:hypothetical protein